MDHCIQTLLTAGEEAEIILIDDGSSDNTPAIADRYAAQYPTIVRAIHQPNGGHGEGVNQGLRNATGTYYKVVDSDDWLDTDSLRRVMDKLRQFYLAGTALDLMICNMSMSMWKITPAMRCTIKMCSRRDTFLAGRMLENSVSLSIF